jgi:hypothetical protein
VLDGIYIFIFDINTAEWTAKILIYVEVVPIHKLLQTKQYRSVYRTGQVNLKEENTSEVLLYT